MLPQIIELTGAMNIIVASEDINADTNALTSPVLSNASATKFQISFNTPASASFTIEGLDADGNFQTEILIAPAGGEITIGHYTSVSSIVPNVSITTLNVEYSDGICTPTIPVNWRQSPFNLAMVATTDPTVDPEAFVIFQYSLDNPDRDFPGNFINGTQWFDIAGEVSNPAVAVLNAPAQAMRIITSDGSSGMTWLFRIIQGDNPQ